MTRDRINELLDEAEELPDSPAKVTILEEAIREADALGDETLSYEARMQLVLTATVLDLNERALVAFAWCLAQYDRQPDRHDGFELLWRFKWIMINLPSYPEISRQQIVRMQDDMERRYREYGASLRTVHYIRCTNAMLMGDDDLAQQCMRLWRRARRDELTDCPACERDHEVSYASYRGRDEQALQLAAPLLSRELSCPLVLESTYTELIRPCMRLKRLDEARELHRKGFRLLSRPPASITGVAEHLLLLVRLGELPRCTMLMEKHLNSALQSADPDRRLNFFLSSALVCEALAAARPRRKLSLPQQLPCYREDGDYDLAALAGWFRAQVAELVARFNRRNGNDSYTRDVEEAEELARP